MPSVLRRRVTTALALAAAMATAAVIPNSAHGVSAGDALDPAGTAVGIGFGELV
jgi:hypothetical protein